MSRNHTGPRASKRPSKWPNVIVPSDRSVWGDGYGWPRTYDVVLDKRTPEGAGGAK